MSNELLPAIFAIAALSLAFNAYQWLSVKKLAATGEAEINELRSRLASLREELHEAQSERQADRIRFENDHHEQVKLQRAKAFEEGRELGKAEQRKDHVEEITRIYQENVKKTAEEVEHAVADAKDRVRSEYELQSKMFSVQISPYVQITEDKGLISSSYVTEAGYQYQLLVNGIPSFQPHIIIERTETRKEVSQEKLNELVSTATEIAASAISTYLSSGAKAFAKIAPAVIRRLGSRG